MSELSVWILKPYKTFSFCLIIWLHWALFSLRVRKLEALVLTGLTGFLPLCEEAMTARY